MQGCPLSGIFAVLVLYNILSEVCHEQHMHAATGNVQGIYIENNNGNGSITNYITYIDDTYMIIHA